MTADRGEPTTFGVPQNPQGQKVKKGKHVLHWFRKGSLNVQNMLKIIPLLNSVKL